MNLIFKDVHTVDREGVPFMLQIADVTRCADFWRVWRSPAADSLKKLVFLRYENDRWNAYRLKAVTGDDYAPFNLSYQLCRTDGLLSYQPEAVAHLIQSIIDNGAAADGSDTGIGKTYHALGVCRELNLTPCVICRKAGMAGWWRGCKKMNVSPWLIANWEMMRTAKITKNGKPVLTREKRSHKAGYDFTWHLPKGVLLIFDEAHLGFNPDSQNYALWTASAGLASLSMSATFADRPARLKGLFSVLRLMNEEQFDSWLLNRGHFMNQYNDIESLTSVEDMVAINKLLYPKYGYRVSYEDPEVKKMFPERVIQTEIVSLGEKITEEQNVAYAEFIEKALKYKELGKQAMLMVADLRYRQHAELLKGAVLIELAREYLYEGMSVLIFVNFRETLRFLAEQLKTKSLIFGDQERYGLSREAVIENFQNGKEKLILCMTDAGGQSIDLHDVNRTGRRISLICPTYNPVALQQVLGRTYRAGTKSTPIMKLVYAAGTVEEKVAETVNRKLDNIAALNDGDLMEPDLLGLGIKRGDV